MLSLQITRVVMVGGRRGRQAGTEEVIPQADVRTPSLHFTALWPQAGHMTSVNRQMETNRVTDATVTATMAVQWVNQRSSSCTGQPSIALPAWDGSCLGSVPGFSLVEAILPLFFCEFCGVILH